MAELFRSKPNIQLLHRLFSELSKLKILAFIWTLDISFNSHIAFVSKKAKLPKVWISHNTDGHFLEYITSNQLFIFFRKMLTQIWWYNSQSFQLCKVIFLRERAEQA